MNMTNREKTLVIFLLVAAILAGGYFLVAKPQMRKVDTLQADQEDLRIQVRTVEAQISSLANLRAGVDEMVAKIGEDTTEYFPSILTEKLLLVLDDLFVKNGLVVGDATFTAPGPVQAANTGASGGAASTGALSLGEIRDRLNALENDEPAPTPTPAVPVDPAAVQQSLGSLTGMTVTLNVSAPYESLTGFLGGLESLKRSLAVTSLALERQEDGTVGGTLSLVFYALPKLAGDDTEYLDWPYTGEYGKPDPFAAPGYDMTLNVAAFAQDANNLAVTIPSLSDAALLAAAEENVADVAIAVSPAAGGYACSIRIGELKYPAAGTATVTSDETAIRILVTSTARADEEDLAGITLAVSNTTDRPVLVTLIGDDPVRPRVAIGTLEGSVTVR